MSQPFFSADTSRGSIAQRRSAAITASMAQLLDLGAGVGILGEARRLGLELRALPEHRSSPCGITNAAPLQHRRQGA